MPRRDSRSPEAQAYRRWYKSKAWTWARVAQLHKEPLCERCKAKGTITPATVVNHKTPHRGDWRLFIDPANHESTCKQHHDSAIQSEERLGYSKEVGSDGWPIDPNHPANRERKNLGGGAV